MYLWLGKARIATINKDETTIVDGKGSAEKIGERILFIKDQLDKGDLSMYEIEKLQERLGKMTGGLS